MMKATAWFCPVLLTLLSATRLVCTAQRGAVTGAGTAGTVGYANGYPLDYLDAQSIQDEYSMAKRNKPSLSIVNPLDVLRQRLLLEIARRQMKENTRQVELNRAILKNVGKRMFLEPETWTNSRYGQQQQQERKQAALREQLRREQLQQQHFPSQLWSYGWPQQTSNVPSYAAPSSSSSSLSSAGSSRFFDFLQRPEPQTRQQPAVEQLLNDANKSHNGNALGLSLGLAVSKHQQPNGNENSNETNHENVNRKVVPPGKSATGNMNDDNNEEDDEAAANDEQNDMLDELNLNWVSEQPDEIDNSIDATNENGRLPWRLVYRMHKNAHYAN